MPKFDVHLYVTVRIKVKGVEAPSMAVAAAHVDKELSEDLDLRPLSAVIDEHDAEYAEEVSGALVDEADALEKEDFSETTYFIPGKTKTGWRKARIRVPKP